MKKSVFIFLLFSFTHLLSNNHGYLGKKNMIKYELGIWHPYAAGVFSTYRPILHNCITFEHSFKAGSAFGVVISRFDMQDQLSYRKLEKNGVPYTIKWQGLPNYTTTSSSTMFEVNIKRYHIGYRFNPQGSYFSAGIFCMYSHVNDVAFRLNYAYYPDRSIAYATRRTYNQVDGGIALAFGRNSMIGTRFVMGTEFKFCWPLRSFIKLAYLGDDYEIFERTFLYNILQFKISFGTLL